MSEHTDDQTDEDKAWAWLGRTGLTVREYPHGAYCAVLRDGVQIATGNTRDAAVLNAWRKNMEDQQ